MNVAWPLFNPLAHALYYVKLPGIFVVACLIPVFVHVYIALAERKKDRKSRSKAWKDDHKKLTKKFDEKWMMEMGK